MESDSDFGAAGLAGNFQWEAGMDMGSGVDTSGAPLPSFILEEKYSS